MINAIILQLPRIEWGLLVELSGGGHVYVADIYYALHVYKLEKLGLVTCWDRDQNVSGHWEGFYGVKITSLGQKCKLLSHPDEDAAVVYIPIGE